VLRQALLEAGAIRFKPIFLTAATAMIGAAFIRAVPIFQGLAISLVFGLASSTALTGLAIPAVYVWLRDDHRGLPRGYLVRTAAGDGWDAALANWPNAASAWLAYITDGPAPI
jgi:predicted RND superfamily exporter protein